MAFLGCCVSSVSGASPTFEERFGSPETRPALSPSLREDDDGAEAAALWPEERGELGALPPKALFPPSATESAAPRPTEPEAPEREREGERELQSRSASAPTIGERGATPAPAEALPALTLHRAAALGSAADVERLLAARGVDVNECGADGDAPLHKAAAGGHTELVVALLQARAEPDVRDKKSKTALRKAYFSAEVSSALLGGNADPNLADRDGRTALHVAAEVGQVDVLQLLVASRASLDAATHGNARTALHEAACFGQVGSLRYLLDARADTVRADAAGNTALHMAACATSPEGPEVCRLLVELGNGDVTAINAAGETALQCAQAAENTDTAAVLSKA